MEFWIVNGFLLNKVQTIKMCGMILFQSANGCVFMAYKNSAFNQGFKTRKIKKLNKIMDANINLRDNNKSHFYIFTTTLK